MLCAICVIATSCVKDVDFDQTKNIGLSPDLQTDLLIYDVNEDYFYSENKEFRSIIRDTVRLEFLDDDYIQDDLSEVEFYFRHINTFPYAFSNTIKFLSLSDGEQFRVEYEIPPGSENNPSEIDHIEYIEEARIGLVRNSIKMVVELEVLTGTEEFKGDLDFASKGLFMFEF